MESPLSSESKDQAQEVIIIEGIMVTDTIGIINLEVTEFDPCSSREAVLVESYSQSGLEMGEDVCPGAFFTYVDHR